MRICFFAADNSWHMPIWVNYFAAKGHDVHFVTIKAAKAAPKVELGEGVKFHYLPAKVIKTPFLGGLLALPWRVLFVRKTIRDIRPDVINAVNMEFGFWAAFSGFHPFVMTAQASEVIILPKKSKIAKWKNRFVFSFVDAVTADSEVCMQAAIWGGAPEGRRHIVQWGVDFEKFNMKVDKSVIRDKLNLQGVPVIFSPRGFSEIYNIDTIIRSIPIVLNELPDAKFVFCYHFTTLERKLKRLVTELGIEESVIFGGFVSESEMPYYMAASDICVSVPSSDSSPRSVYEAMACGVPVILSDLPWWGGKLVPEENALIVPVRDHRALARAIVKLYTDKELRNGMKKANSSFVSSNLDSRKHRAKLETLFRSLVKS